MSDFPEHAKLKEIEDDRDTVQHFLDWLLDEQDMTLAVYGRPQRYARERDEEDLTNEGKLFGLQEGMHPITKTFRGRGLREKIMAAYFGIDLDALADEKDQALEALRRLNA